MTWFLRAICCLALLVPGWAAATEYPAKDAVENWRERVEAARLLAVPKPPAGVRDLSWGELAPPGWNPGDFLKQFHSMRGAAPDPRSTFATAQTRRLWDQAPAVKFDNDNPVRLTGYPVMLDAGDALSKTILLVPYDRAGKDRPAPPANQMVMVVLTGGMPRNLRDKPVWITGRLVAARMSTPYGVAAYTMPQGSWAKYPIEHHPMPKYAPKK